MAVGAERRAGPGDGEIGAGDNAERAMERYGEDAAQCRQRPPDLLVLHEIGQIFVGGEAEAGGGAIDHGIHRVSPRPASRRNHDDNENFDDLLGRRDP